MITIEGVPLEKKHEGYPVVFVPRTAESKADYNHGVITTVEANRLLVLFGDSITGDPIQVEPIYMKWIDKKVKSSLGDLPLRQLVELLPPYLNLDGAIINFTMTKINSNWRVYANRQNKSTTPAQWDGKDIAFEAKDLKIAVIAMLEFLDRNRLK